MVQLKGGIGEAISSPTLLDVDKYVKLWDKII